MEQDMWKLQIQLIEFFSNIATVKIFCLIILFSFLCYFIKRVRKLIYLFLLFYLPIFVISFTLKDYGIDSVRWNIMRKNLIPIAYISYKQDLEIMRTLSRKRSYSIYVYKNIDRFNEEFNEILKFLENERGNKLELKKIEVEKLNMS